MVDMDIRDVDRREVYLQEGSLYAMFTLLLR